ncbi:hypothetical protein BLNAU_2417 [Blattamonas nauphoetae]|uniref:non-specific serine/threonine protein kinase n=1 Tax=Blattamonas nauphoetae TaxID=2049346 RepID=A0ABQ9YFZ9_9EUKA|nr:hypothetical protein BLNAU_2417 [Blattamonas nauphoetae]
MMNLVPRLSLFDPTHHQRRYSTIHRNVKRPSPGKLKQKGVRQGFTSSLEQIGVMCGLGCASSIVGDLSWISLLLEPSNSTFQSIVVSPSVGITQAAVEAQFEAIDKVTMTDSEKCKAMRHFTDFEGTPLLRLIEMSLKPSQVFIDRGVDSTNPDHRTDLIDDSDDSNRDSHSRNDPERRGSEHKPNYKTPLSIPLPISSLQLLQLDDEVRQTLKELPEFVRRLYYLEGMSMDIPQVKLDHAQWLWKRSCGVHGIGLGIVCAWDHRKTHHWAPSNTNPGQNSTAINSLPNSLADIITQTRQTTSTLSSAIERHTPSIMQRRKSFSSPYSVTNVMPFKTDHLSHEHTAKTIESVLSDHESLLESRHQELPPELGFLHNRDALGFGQFPSPNETREDRVDFYGKTILTPLLLDPLRLPLPRIMMFSVSFEDVLDSMQATLPVLASVSNIPDFFEQINRSLERISTSHTHSKQSSLQQALMSQIASRRQSLHYAHSDTGRSKRLSTMSGTNPPSSSSHRTSATSPIIFNPKQRSSGEDKVEARPAVKESFFHRLKMKFNQRFKTNRTKTKEPSQVSPKIATTSPTIVSSSSRNNLLSAYRPSNANGSSPKLLLRFTDPEPQTPLDGHSVFPSPHLVPSPQPIPPSHHPSGQNFFPVVPRIDVPLSSSSRHTIDSQDELMINGKSVGVTPVGRKVLPFLEMDNFHLGDGFTDFSWHYLMLANSSTHIAAFLTSSFTSYSNIVSQHIATQAPNSTLLPDGTREYVSFSARRQNVLPFAQSSPFTLFSTTPVIKILTSSAKTILTLREKGQLPYSDTMSSMSDRGLLSERRSIAPLPQPKPIVLVNNVLQAATLVPATPKFIPAEKIPKETFSLPIGDLDVKSEAGAFTPQDTLRMKVCALKVVEALINSAHGLTIIQEKYIVSCLFLDVEATLSFTSEQSQSGQMERALVSVLKALSFSAERRSILRANRSELNPLQITSASSRGNTEAFNDAVVSVDFVKEKSDTLSFFSNSHPLTNRSRVFNSPVEPVDAVLEMVSSYLGEILDKVHILDKEEVKQLLAICQFLFDYITLASSSTMHSHVMMYLSSCLVVLHQSIMDTLADAMQEVLEERLHNPSSPKELSCYPWIDHPTFYGEVLDDAFGDRRGDCFELSVLFTRIITHLTIECSELTSACLLLWFTFGSPNEETQSTFTISAIHANQMNCTPTQLFTPPMKSRTMICALCCYCMSPKFISRDGMDGRQQASITALSSHFSGPISDMYGKNIPTVYLNRLRAGFSLLNRSMAWNITGERLSSFLDEEQEVIQWFAEKSGQIDEEIHWPWSVCYPLIFPENGIFPTIFLTSFQRSAGTKNNNSLGVSAFLPMIEVRHNPPARSSIHPSVFIRFLRLLLELNSLPHNPFVSLPSYHTYYITKHWSCAIRCYSAWRRPTDRKVVVGMDHPATSLMPLRVQMEVCNLHIRNLISFAVNKRSEHISYVFHRFDVVEFINRELSIEHSIGHDENDLLDGSTNYSTRDIARMSRRFFGSTIPAELYNYDDENRNLIIKSMYSVLRSFRLPLVPAKEIIVDEDAERKQAGDSEREAIQAFIHSTTLIPHNTQLDGLSGIFPPQSATPSTKSESKCDQSHSIFSMNRQRSPRVQISSMQSPAHSLHSSHGKHDRNKRSSTHSNKNEKRRKEERHRDQEGRTSARALAALPSGLPMLDRNGSFISQDRMNTFSPQPEDVPTTLQPSVSLSSLRTHNADTPHGENHNKSPFGPMASILSSNFGSFSNLGNDASHSLLTGKRMPQRESSESLFFSPLQGQELKRHQSAGYRRDNSLFAKMMKDIDEPSNQKANPNAKLGGTTNKSKKSLFEELEEDVQVRLKGGSGQGDTSRRSDDPPSQIDEGDLPSPPRNEEEDEISRYQPFHGTGMQHDDPPRELGSFSNQPEEDQPAPYRYGEPDQNEEVDTQQDALPLIRSEPVRISLPEEFGEDNNSDDDQPRKKKKKIKVVVKYIKKKKRKEPVLEPTSPRDEVEDPYGPSECSTSSLSGNEDGVMFTLPPRTLGQTSFKVPMMKLTADNMKGGDLLSPHPAGVSLSKSPNPLSDPNGKLDNSQKSEPSSTRLRLVRKSPEPDQDFEMPKLPERRSHSDLQIAINDEFVKPLRQPRRVVVSKQPEKSEPIDTETPIPPEELSKMVSLDIQPKQDEQSETAEDEFEQPKKKKKKILVTRFIKKKKKKTSDDENEVENIVIPEITLTTNSQNASPTVSPAPVHTPSSHSKAPTIHIPTNHLPPKPPHPTPSERPLDFERPMSPISPRSNRADRMMRKPEMRRRKSMWEESGSERETRSEKMGLMSRVESMMDVYADGFIDDYHYENPDVFPWWKNEVYIRERLNRPMFWNEELHCNSILLMIALLVKGNGTLDGRYCSSNKDSEGVFGKRNVSYILFQHLSHTMNVGVVRLLQHALSGHLGELGVQMNILLKLSSRFLFKPQNMKMKKLIGAGQFGCLKSVKMTQKNCEVFINDLDDDFVRIMVSANEPTVKRTLSRGACLPTCSCHGSTIDGLLVGDLQLAKCPQCRVKGYLAPQHEPGNPGMSICSVCGYVCDAPGVEENEPLLSDRSVISHGGSMISGYDNSFYDQMKVSLSPRAAETSIFASHQSDKIEPPQRSAQRRMKPPRAKRVRSKPVYVAVKLLPVPESILKKNNIINAFAEVSILTKLRNTSRDRVSLLLDCGVDGENLYIVEKQYTCNLREWRVRHLQFEPTWLHDSVDGQGYEIENERTALIEEYKKRKKNSETECTFYHTWFPERVPNGKGGLEDQYLMATLNGADGHKIGFRNKRRGVDPIDEGEETTHCLVEVSEMVDLYLRIFFEVLEGVEYLHMNSVNHYDLKCANIFISPKDAKTLSHLGDDSWMSRQVTADQAFQHNTDADHERYPCGPLIGRDPPPPEPLIVFTPNAPFSAAPVFWDPNPKLYKHNCVKLPHQSDNSPETCSHKQCRFDILDSSNITELFNAAALLPDQPAVSSLLFPPLPFTVAIGDFGESVNYSSEGESYIQIDRGTECVKSPEMLDADIRRQVDGVSFDRRVYTGAGRSSDVWSLGCLLYELVTGQYLFLDEDNGHFMLKMKSEDIPILSDLNRRRLEETKEPRLTELLLFILQRDTQRRPSIAEIKRKVLEILSARHQERFLRKMRADR